MHKRAENLRARVEEYRQYSDYLESLLEDILRDHHPHRTIDFRASRPSDSDGLLGPSSDVVEHDFDFSVMVTEDNDTSPEPDPTKEICLPTQSLKVCS
jgi:hypothetical protein